MLRQPTLDDSDAWYDYLKHPEVAKYVPDPCIPASYSHAKSEFQWYISMFDKQTGFSWAIVDQTNNKLIGTISTEKWVPYHRRCEIAYDLNPYYWGQGLMQEALNACLKFVFKKMEIVRVEAYTTTCNTRSIKLLERLGFKHEALMHKQRWFKNKHIDVNLFALTDDAR